VVSIRREIGISADGSSFGRRAILPGIDSETQRASILFDNEQEHFI